jgi:hypothetical protein
MLKAAGGKGLPLPCPFSCRRWNDMDFWIVICCSAVAGSLFLGIVGLLILLLFRENSKKNRIGEE